MKQVDNLYKKLIVSLDTPGKKGKIDEEVRDKLYQKILDNLKKLRKKQQKNEHIPEEYSKLDYEMRALLLKEIQVILDEYILAKANNDLKSWKEMYGDGEYYIRNFFYYRMDENYESQKKILKDYKFFVE